MVTLLKEVPREIAKALKKKAKPLRKIRLKKESVDKHFCLDDLRWCAFCSFCSSWSPPTSEAALKRNHKYARNQAYTIIIQSPGFINSLLNIHITQISVPNHIHIDENMYSRVLFGYKTINTRFLIACTPPCKKWSFRHHCSCYTF